ncbi:cardiolipin synthase [Neobacillus mesonae]|uniref:Cardiolipin synthase n=1 Tax=Neobacillus mesonae TaxID=1193713 RepID=A0A3T0I4T8_9BACI|nr:cardiolipin synthase [Neobacillus mesonae]AZU64340.1 cardiolipin synthase [Neobacillus mesonae]MED4203576.1 cardiolipin synthase [Neobacillus mesonae]
MEMQNVIALLVALITILNILFAIVVIFVERRDVSSTWAWLMVLFFLPIVGFFVYIFLGRQLKQRNFYQLAEEERNFLNDAVNIQLEQLTSSDFNEKPLLKEHADLITMNMKSSNALLTDDNEVTIFQHGRDKFESLFEDIQNAKKEINLEYYIIQRDSLGKRLRDELTKKAKEGVRVRVLYDEVGSRRMDRSFFKELIDSGGEVEVFFPSFLKLINFRFNTRNHRKLCIIDGEMAYIGGFNIGNEYLGLNKKFGNWRDTHLKITGDAVTHIQGRFVLDWKQATKQEIIDYEAYSISEERKNGSSAIQIISSGPNSMTEHLKNMYLKLIMSAQRSVYIQTPYFVPDSSFMDVCKMALLSGVDVRIMIPNKPDHPFVRWANLAYAGELLPYGAKILLYDNGFLHAKSIVVDQEVASVGTTNIDLRSFRLNFEVNALIYDEKIARNLYDLFLADSQDSVELTLEQYKERSGTVRFKESISRLLSPIL